MFGFKIYILFVLFRYGFWLVVKYLNIEVIILFNNYNKNEKRKKDYEKDMYNKLFGEDFKSFILRYF